MSETHEYRQFANDCIVWARMTTSDDMRARLLELAKKVEQRRGEAGTCQSIRNGGSGNRSAG